MGRFLNMPTEKKSNRQSKLVNSGTMKTYILLTIKLIQLCQIGATTRSYSAVTEGYFFDIYYERLENEIYFQYETRWSPNIDDVAQLCKEFEVCAHHEYTEPGCQIYGTAMSDENGCYSVNQIEEEFLDLIEYDIERDMYVYEGEYWDSEMELIETEYPNWKEKNF